MTYELSSFSALSRLSIDDNDSTAKPHRCHQRGTPPCVLTLAPVGLGRREYIVALSGIELLRKMTVDLMLMENDVGQRERGGALRLNPFLSSEQIRLVQSLPAV